MSAPCIQLDQIQDVMPQTAADCEECLQTRDWWGCA